MWGASQWVRSLRVLRATEGIQRRFIPAPAGSATASCVIKSPTGVHPRPRGVCGGPQRPFSRGSGPSLREQGLHQVTLQFLACSRFIPAPTGSAGEQVFHGQPVEVHPRACGVCLVSLPLSGCFWGSSPFLRGLHESTRTRGKLNGSSPRLRGLPSSGVSTA